MLHHLRSRLPDRADDRGFTLTEMIVTVSLLAVFMSIFTTVTYLMTSTTNKVQRLSEGVRQANQAFLALDKSVRYASAISNQAVTNGVWHVEFDTPTLTSNGMSEKCTQLRVSGTQLQQRTWTISGSTYAQGSLTSWVPLSSFVTNGGAAATSDDRPFVVSTAGQFQRLTMTIISAGNASSSTDTNRASTSFAAVNSVAGSAANAAACQQVAVGSAS